MGVVYRALDTKLDRDVAIKTLPDAVALDAARLARLVREARTLASLNHANIGAIYGFEEAGGRHYLIMEHVDGETLESRLSRGAIPLKASLGLALQIAHGLEAAHEKGVIHRDLKPANIKITPAEQVKVLDFGLAKAELAELGSGAVTAMPAGTLSTPGAIMGTAGYLSPEQARGAAVDQRSDIFAFGCILFEMLTGMRAFGRGSVIESISAAIHDEPDLERLPAETPDLVRLLLGRCLAKNPRDRLHHASDVRILLESAEKGGMAGPAATAAHPGIEVRTFPISSELCRQFDRTGFDPRLIGHEMQYADNGVSSDVLVIFLHSIGQDHRRWSEVLQSLRYRGLAPTQVGFEPVARVRVGMPLRDHVLLHRAFVRQMQQSLVPTTTILVGFSSGADIAMRVMADPGEAPRIDGLIALEANTSVRTHHVSAHFAQLEPQDEASLLRRLGELSATADSVNVWTTLHNYLVAMVLKMQDDLLIVRDFARELIAQFPTDDSAPFAAWYRAATQSVREVRCIVCEGGDYHRDIQALRLSHLDSNCLGERYRDDTIIVEPGVTHRELTDPLRVLEYVNEVVRRLARPRWSGREATPPPAARGVP